MKSYLVGGAIRDKLLGLQPKERDWVVVGSSQSEMISKGFIQVGKDFPVFIHPKTGEEYALARTERKSGHGYTGFDFNTSSDVTLEQDLERRDLTINAIAQDDKGNLIDPFNGKEDIEKKILRNVSHAFSEDPLRVLRVARFKCNFPDFTVAESTTKQIEAIVKNGELQYLTGERIWMELCKSNDPFIFSRILSEWNAESILPGYKKTEYTQNKKYSKFNILSLFLHHAIDDLDSFCKKLKVPNEYKDLAILLDNCKDDFLSYIPKHDNHIELLSIIKKLDIRKTKRLDAFFEIVKNESKYVHFIETIISEIKNYKLSAADSKKSVEEIQKIIHNKHCSIIKDYISETLNK